MTWDELVEKVSKMSVEQRAGEALFMEIGEWGHSGRFHKVILQEALHDMIAVDSRPHYTEVGSIKRGDVFMCLDYGADNLGKDFP